MMARQRNKVLREQRIQTFKCRMRPATAVGLYRTGHELSAQVIACQYQHPEHVILSV